MRRSSQLSQSIIQSISFALTRRGPGAPDICLLDYLEMREPCLCTWSRDQISGECFYLNRWRRYARQAGLDSSRLTTPPEMHNSRYDAFTWKRKSSSASSLPRREPCPEDFIGSHFVEKNSVPWCIWFQIQKYSSRVLALQGLQSFLNISCPTRCGVRCCRIDFNHSHILPDELPSIWLLTS